MVFKVQQRLHSNWVEDAVEGVHKRHPIMAGSAKELRVGGQT